MARRPLTSLPFPPRRPPAGARATAPAASMRFAEHSIVTRSSDMRLDDGRVLPSGAKGAVVGIWRDGVAYEVEFDEPFHAVVTVPVANLRQAGRASA